MKNEVIIFNSATEENLSSEMQERQEEVTMFLMKKIIWALENNVDEFTFAEIPETGLSLSAKRSDFFEALNINFDKLLAYEEYELCAKVKEWIDYLEVENINKKTK